MAGSPFAGLQPLTGGTGRDRGSYRLQEAAESATPGVLSAGGERLARAPALALPRLLRGGFWPTGSASMVTRRTGEERGPDQAVPRIMAAAVAAAEANRQFENGGGSGGGQSARRVGRVARRRRGGTSEGRASEGRGAGGGEDPGLRGNWGREPLCPTIARPLRLGQGIAPSPPVVRPSLKPFLLSEHKASTPRPPGERSNVIPVREADINKGVGRETAPYLRNQLESQKFTSDTPPQNTYEQS